MQIKISIIASAVRKQWFELFLNSLVGAKIPIEVIFVGRLSQEEVKEFYNCPYFKYITTGDIKPAQCYEIARRAATGELIHFSADDCEYEYGLFDLAYADWKAEGNKKLIYSLQTIENYGHGNVLTDMNNHTLNGKDTPLMAPLALINRQFLQELGGFDRRYICGQYENDILMNAYTAGGNCVIWNKKVINIDHFRKHGQDGHLRPFARGYNHDRNILETTWCGPNRTVLNKRHGKFEPYEDKDILTKSQSYTKSVWSN